MLKLGVEVDTDGAARGMGKLESVFEKASNAVGIAGGIALGAALVEAIDLSGSRGKLQAQLGVTADESKRIGDVAGKLFANAYGNSMEDVNGAVTAVIRNMDGMKTASSAALEEATGRAITLSEVMGEDVGKTTEAVSQLMRTGLAKNSKDAFDILTRGAQLGVDKSHDLLDTFIEYPVQFKKLGLDANVAMGILNQGLQAGARNSDLVADALKEFSIRAVDGSKLTAKGFDMVGLSGDVMAERISKGGKSAADALALTLKQLRAIPDPVMRSQAAVALFGTQAEDLGDALLAIDPTTAVKSLGKVSGAADAAGKALGETAASRMESFKRSVETNVVHALDIVISGFAKLPNAVQNGLVQFATVATLAAPAIAAIVKLRGAMVSLAATSVVSSFIGKIGSAFDTLRLKTMYAFESFSNAEGATSKFKTAMGGIGSVATKAKTALSGAAGLLGGPWGIALAAGIGAIALFAGRHAEAEERIKGFTDAVKEDSGVLGDNTRAKVVNQLETDGLLKSAQKLGINTKLFTDAALGNKDALAQVNAQLAKNTVTMSNVTGRGATAAKSFTTMSFEAKVLQEALGDTNSELGQSVASYNRTTTAMGKTDKAIDPVVAGNYEISSSADKAAMKTASLTKQLNGFKTLAGDADLAAIDFKESLDRLSTSMGKNNSSLSKRTSLFNTNTAKGRDNTRMVIDAIRAAADHSDKLVKEGKSVDFANKSFAREIGQLRGVLEKMHLSKDAINTLISKYADMARKVNSSTNSIKDRKVRIEVRAGGTLVGYHVQGGTLLKASGGVLPGYTPGRDVHYFRGDNGMNLGLSGGEAIMRPEFTYGVGKQWVDQMNYIARTGGKSAVRKALGTRGANGPGNKKLGGEGMFYAGGGIISQNSVGNTKAIEAMCAKANKLYGIWAGNMGVSISKAFTKMLGIGGPKVQKALAFAKKQAGKPYVWGGVGPGGWDCSGFMGSLWAIIKGKNPYQRYFSTFSFGNSSGPGGFVRNAQSGFKVGVTNAGVGHMAGTLGKTNVESSGSRGVHIGASARGWNNGLFGYHYGLKMDNGGVLPPRSVTTVYNGTNKPEYAIPHRFMKDADSGDVHITINAGMGTNPRELEDAVYKAMKKYKSRNGRSLSV